MPSLCLYCAAPLTEANRSLAHVVPHSLGGRLASLEICCASCNNSFTSIESQCAARLAPASSTFGAKRGDGSAISATIDLDGSKFRASGSAMYEEAPPPSDNGRVWSLPARPESQISWLAVALRQRKLSPEALIDGRLKIVDAPPEPDPAGLTDPDAGVEIPMSWGDPPTKRLMIKCTCELLAHAKPDLARAGELRIARDYARYGRGDFHIALDRSTKGAELAAVAAPFVHSVDVWTRGRTVYLRFGFFTEFRFAGVLANEWSGPAFRMSYSFDCRNPTDMVYTVADGDGDWVVRFASALIRRELLAASERLSESMREFFTDRRAYRASALSEDELYKGLKAVFDAKPWAVAS